MAKPKRKRQYLAPRSGEPKRTIVFSLKDFDINQGQSFEDWEKESILSELMTRLRQVSNYSVPEAEQQRILKIYGDFPPESDFIPPRHISPGVNWASISIRGKIRIGGYLEDNVFYIVFLDKDHRFWISKKKHT